MQAELIEQRAVVQHEVAEVAQTVHVTRLGAARGMRDQHTEIGGPRPSELPAMERAGAMEEDERGRCRVSQGQHDSVGAVDVQSELLETLGGVHAETPRCWPRPSPTATFLERNRGMTSSANSVRFLTTFQCGMSPSAKLSEILDVSASSAQWAIASATFSGVPAMMRLIAVRSSQFADPCTSAEEIRRRNSGTVR